MLQNFDEKYDYIASCFEKYEIIENEGKQVVLDDVDEISLTGLLYDQDEIIRASAVDALGYSVKTDTLNRLLTLSKKDKSRIVRSYCFGSVMDIAKTKNSVFEIEKELREIFYKEKSLFVKLAWIPDMVEIFSEKEDFCFLVGLIEKGFNSRNRHYRNLAAEAILSDTRLLRFFSLESIEKLIKKERCLYILEKLYICQQKRQEIKN